MNQEKYLVHSDVESFYKREMHIYLSVKFLSGLHVELFLILVFLCVNIFISNFRGIGRTQSRQNTSLSGTISAQFLIFWGKLAMIISVFM